MSAIRQAAPEPRWRHSETAMTGAMAATVRGCSSSSGKCKPCQSEHSIMELICKHKFAQLLDTRLCFLTNISLPFYSFTSFLSLASIASVHFTVSLDGSHGKKKFKTSAVDGSARQGAYSSPYEQLIRRSKCASDLHSK